MFIFEHVRLLVSLFSCFCSIVYGLGFLGHVCVHMLLVCICILVVCICIQMGCVHILYVCERILLPRDLNTFCLLFLCFIYMFNLYLT